MNRLSLGLVPFFLFSAYGWGRLCRPFADRRLLRVRILSVILGLSLLNAIGGVLNLLGWATSGTLLILMLGGIAWAALDLLKSRPWANYRWHPFQIPLVVALLCAAAAGALLMPTEIFNIADDFHVYLVRVARMCDTGSMGGNPLDLLGVDGLGTQSFFQGFFLAGLDIRLLQGFDAVSCFALCLLLPAELSARMRLPWLAGVLAVLCAVFINPQQVNISPLYSGAVAVMAIIVCGVFLARSLASPNGKSRWRIDLSLALIVAWLMALKATLALFGMFFIVFLYLLFYFRAYSRRGIVQSALTVAGVVALILLPWLFVCLRSVLTARAAGIELQQGATIAAKFSSMAAHDVSGLFSTAPLQYGDRTYSFLFLALACVAAGLYSLLGRPGGARARDPAARVALAAAAFAIPPVLLVNCSMFPASTAIRYTCPTLIGVFVTTAVFLLRIARSQIAPERRRLILTVAGCTLAVIIIFGNSCWSRIRLAVANRTILAYPVDSAHVKYCHAMTSQFEAEYVQSVQTNMVAGSTALVEVVTPFLMDFSHNRLLTVSEPGLANPLLKFPAGIGVGELENYLRRNGIRYVLIETNGYGVPKLEQLRIMADSRFAVYRKYAEFEIYLRTTLLDMVHRNSIRYSDDRMLLFELKEAHEPSPPHFAGGQEALMP